MPLLSQQLPDTPPTVRIERYADDVTRAADGIWYAPGQAVDYPEDGHSACFAVEDDSFWFAHRNRCIQALLEHVPPPPGGPLFDIGGGNGFVALGLQRPDRPVVLIEPGPVGARHARSRGLEHVVCATTATAGIRRASLPAIGLFDVIEHIADDRGFMHHMADLLVPGGTLYASVPAYNVLWSHEDIAAGHHRRHTAGSMHRLFAVAGLHVEFATYIFRPLPLPVLLMRTLPFRLGLAQPHAPADVARDHGAGNPVLSRLAARLLAPEVRNIVHGRAMRFGGSVLIAARKPPVTP